MRLKNPASVLLLLAACAPLAAQPLPESLLACSRIAQDTQRLACLDREIARLSGSATPRAAAASSAAAAPNAAAAPSAAPAPSAAAAPSTAAAAPLSPEQTFGLSPEQVRKRESKEGTGPAQVTGLSAHIASLSRNASGRWLFTLDNGQVWRQSETRTSFEAAPGNAVTISSGAFGSFRLETSKHNWTRVERVL